MNNRLAIVALTGLLVGTVVGGIWLSQDLPEVTPVVTVASRSKAEARDEQSARGPKSERGSALDAGTAARSKARLDPTRGEATRPTLRPRDAGADPPEGDLRRPPGGDTGLPSPAAVLGLPGDDADDSALVAGLAEERPPLPDRPLSNYELETLEDRAAWLDQTCAGSSDPSCAAARENIDQALEEARTIRAAAGLDGDDDTPPPPMLPPPPEDQPPPPEPRLDEDGNPLPPPPEGQGPPPEGQGPPPRRGPEPRDDLNR